MMRFFGLFELLAKHTHIWTNRSDKYVKLSCLQLIVVRETGTHYVML